MKGTTNKQIRRAILAAVLLINADDTQDYWDIISGLRGCDTGDVTLKDLTVARARAVIGITGWRLNVTKHPLSPQERKLRDNILKSAPSHFKAHWNRVVDAIEDVYRYDLRTERPIGKHTYVRKAVR